MPVRRTSERPSWSSCSPHKVETAVPPPTSSSGSFAKLGWTTDKVVPLTFHVTYWDDLGWQDPYGSQLFDQRQVSYAQLVPARRANNETTIRGPYTPQMVIDGRVHFSGTLRDKAREELNTAAAREELIELEATSSYDRARVTVVVSSKGSPKARFDTDKNKIGIFAALTQKRVQTKVLRGENAGKTLVETSVVRHFLGPKLFRSHKPSNQTIFEFPMPDDLTADGAAVVVFAQDLATLAVYGVRTVAVSPPRAPGDPAAAEPTRGTRSGPPTAKRTK